MWLRVANISQVGAGSLLETPGLLATLFYTLAILADPSGASAGKRPRDEEVEKVEKSLRRSEGLLTQVTATIIGRDENVIVSSLPP